MNRHSRRKTRRSSYKKRGGFKYDKPKSKSNRKTASIVLRQNPHAYTNSKTLNKGRTRRTFPKH